MEMMIFDELDDRALKVTWEGSGAGIFGIQLVKYATERLAAAQRQSGGFPVGILWESGGTHFAFCLKRIGVNKSSGNPVGIRWESGGIHVVHEDIGVKRDGNAVC